MDRRFRGSVANPALAFAHRSGWVSPSTLLFHAFSNIQGFGIVCPPSAECVPFLIA
jgi:hypothetical protein